MPQTSYHIAHKIDLALSLCQEHKEIPLLQQLKKSIDLYNDYPGTEREAIQKLLAMGKILTQAIYHSAGTPALEKDLKLAEKELFKDKSEPLSHPYAKALIELVATEKAYFNAIKSKQPIAKFLLTVLSDNKYKDLFAKHQALLKDAFAMLSYLLSSIIKRRFSLSINEEKVLPIFKDLEISVILPISQRSDYRISDGGCIGYSMVFLHSMLNQTLPFGVRSLTDFHYNYISKYAPVNHLARFSHAIAEAYTVYNSNNPKKIAAFSKENFITLTKNEVFMPKATTPANIRNELLKKIIQVVNANNENSGIHLGLSSDKSGHSLAIFPDKTGLHFLDANVGWLHFKKPEEFFIFLDRLLQLYEFREYNCIDISQYASTQVAEIKSTASPVKIKNPAKLFQPISSQTSAVAGMLDISAHVFQTALCSAKNIAINEAKNTLKK